MEILYKYKAYLVILYMFIIIVSGIGYAEDTTMFFDGKILSVQQPIVKIDNVYGIKAFPLKLSAISNKKFTYIGHKVENLSNCLNIIKFDIKTEKGWETSLLLDKNGDGRHQLNEFKSIGNTSQLAEGAVLHFLIKLTRPEDAVPGDTVSVTVNISAVKRDGDSYIGDNGIIYGGPDSVILQDKVVVE